ncbi:MAG: hypothetical protein ACI86H_001222 [bacterium]
MLEIFVTLSILSIAFALFSLHTPQLQKVTNKLTEQALFQEQYLIFLSLFEREYQSAQLVEETKGSEKEIHFYFNRDSDGELLKKIRHIQYRWKEKKVVRKSGDGGFYPFINNVESFVWVSSPLCYEVTITKLDQPTQTKTKIETRIRKSLFCR